MRALLIAAAGATAASLLGFAAASAAPPVATSIQLHPTSFAGGVEVGAWTATGGITDSGDYVRTDVHSTGSLPDCFCPPEHTGAFGEVFVLTSSGSGATLTVKDEERFTPGGEFGNTSGVWQIVSGTGAYARASGHGTNYFGPPQTLYLTGEVSKVD